VSNAPFYLAVAAHLAGILVNVVLALSLCSRIDGLAEWLAQSKRAKEGT
jgi:hypothetical protein